MPGPYSSLMVLRRRASPPPRRPPPGPRFGLCLGWRRGPMGGVMVVYGPPITHSLPPAVGASRTSQFMISKGPAVAQSEHLALWGARPSPPCADEHMVWDLSDGRGLQNCPVRPCRLGVVSGGNEDHKQAPYPPPRPAHTQPKPLPIPAPVAAGRVATGAHKRSLTNATRATTARSGGLSAAPHPPDALGQPAPTLGGFTAASAPSAPPSPRAARAVAARPRGGP